MDQFSARMLHSQFLAIDQRFDQGLPPSWPASSLHLPLASSLALLMDREVESAAICDDRRHLWAVWRNQGGHGVKERGVLNNPVCHTLRVYPPLRTV